MHDGDGEDVPGGVAVVPFALVLLKLSMRLWDGLVSEKGGAVPVREPVGLMVVELPPGEVETVPVEKG